MNDNDLARLREQHAGVLGRRQAIVTTAAAESRDLRRAEARELTQLESDAASRKAQIAHLEELEARTNAPGSFTATVEPHLRAARESMYERDSFTAGSGDPLAIFKGTILEQRSTLTSSNSSALATTGYFTDLIPSLQGESVLLSAGVRTFQTDSTSYVIPTSTAAAAVSWVSEGGTASATDATYAAVTATPAKLVCVSEFSSEVLEDASFSLREAAANEIYRSMSYAVDAVAFGTAATPFPGLGLNAAGGTVTPSGGTVLNLDPFVTAAGSAMAQNVPLSSLTWVSNPIVWQRLGGIHIGGTAYDVRPIIQTDVNTGGAALSTSSLIGRPWFLTTAANAAGGTAFALGFDPSKIALTTRREFNLVVDPYSKAEQGLVRFIATLRASVNALQPKAVVKVAGLVA